MPRSIRWKLAAAFGIPTVIFSLLLGFYLTSVVESFHLDRMRLDLMSQAILMAREFAPDIRERKGAQYIQQHISDHRTPNSDVLRVLVLDAEGVLLGSSRPADAERIGQRIQDPGVREALGGAQASGTTRLGELSESLFAATPIHAGGNIIGALHLSYDLGHVAEVKQQLRLTIGLATAVVGALLLMLSLWIADTVTRPLQALGQAARRVAQGDFEVRATVRSRDEIGQLADSFNHMSARLQEAEDARRQFLADVTHELRGPVGGIKAASEALSAGAGDAPELRAQLVHGMQREADRLGRLVEDMTQLARFETGKMDLRLAETDIVALVNQVHQRFLSEAERRGVRLDVSCPATALCTRADPDRLAQAISNLVDNALKFTPAGGSVRLEAGREESGVWVQVRDTGVGIPAEELPFIFDRSYRGRHSSMSARGGMGLGLAIARGVVEAHGGTVSAESQAGKGSVFTIRLAANFHVPGARSQSSPHHTTV